MRYVVGTTTAVEVVGSELLVCDGEGQNLHRLAGEGRRRFEQVLSDGLVELPDDEVTAALEAAGLLVPVGDPAEKVIGLSRRRALAIGAAAAAAGVVTVALPNAAAAQSEGPGPTTTTTTTPAVTPQTSEAFKLIGSAAGSNVRIYWSEVGAGGSFQYTWSATNTNPSSGGPLNSGEELITIGQRVLASPEPVLVTFTSLAPAAVVSVTL